MAIRKQAPTPLELLRSDVTKHTKDIIALKARIVAAESRLAKVETALGTIGKGEMPPNVERETGTPSESDDAYGEDDASQTGADEGAQKGG